MEKKVLGRGLEALIPKRFQERTRQELVYLSLDMIKQGKYQPRTTMNEKELQDLAQSIKEKGFIQPIVVRRKEGKFEIVAGARRFYAAKLLGIKEIPTIVKQLDDKETFVLAIMENLQRQDLNPLEEAAAFRRLMEEFRLTLEEIGSMLGKDKSSIANTLRLLKLPQEIKEALKRGIISRSQARTILSLNDERKQKELFHRILQEGLSVREIERRVKKSLRRRKPLNPFIADIEERLQKALGTKVKIVDKKNKRGKIIIEYYSAKDLERIIKIII